MPDDPDEFFGGMGFVLRCNEADGYWWADLHHSTGDNPQPFAPKYGRGRSAQDARVSARSRFLVEQGRPRIFSD